MTKIKIKKINGSILSVECDGHANFGAKGEDIVCAALSSIVQTAALGLLQVLGIKIDIKRDDKKGYFKIEIPENLSGEMQQKADIITNTMLLGISDLHEGFSDFIELEVK